MGIERTIESDARSGFSWPALVSKLTALGEKPILRMIDGLPAFPDELPAEDWNELRLGLTGGMVTVRRRPRGFACVTWGTSDPALQLSWNRVCWALADTVSGSVVEEAVEESAAEFARRVGLG